MVMPQGAMTCGVMELLRSQVEMVMMGVLERGFTSNTQVSVTFEALEGLDGFTTIFPSPTFPLTKKTWSELSVTC